jgi:hypothetical protein
MTIPLRALGLAITKMVTKPGRYARTRWVVRKPYGSERGAIAPWRRESDVMPTMEHELEVSGAAAKAAGQVLLRY